MIKYSFTSLHLSQMESIQPSTGNLQSGTHAAYGQTSRKDLHCPFLSVKEDPKFRAFRAKGFPELKVSQCLVTEY